MPAFRKYAETPEERKIRLANFRKSQQAKDTTALPKNLRAIARNSGKRNNKVSLASVPSLSREDV